MRCFLSISIVFILLAQPARAQSPTPLPLSSDSVERTKALNKKIYSAPRRAAIMSAVLPGLGQAYNKKYWKIPIVYAGLGGFGYMFYFNQTEYKFFRKQVIAAYDEDPNTAYDTRYSPEQLQLEKLYYKRYRDLAVMGFSAIYILNIIDANVDAHLKTFDVSDNLSLRISPWQQLSGMTGNPAFAAGVSLKLQFR